MDKRLGVIGIVVEDREVVPKVNKILSEHAEMGVAVISLIIDGSTDEIGSLTGKLGNIPGVTVKSALTKSSKG